jgi:hypothetical protein
VRLVRLVFPDRSISRVTPRMKAMVSASGRSRPG